MKKWNIPFSPPDLGQEEIDEVVDTLKYRLDYHRT